MRLRVDFRPLEQSRASGHALRFAMGGIATVCAALVAKLWGPRIGGLPLALPAILPIGITLIAKLHNRQVGPGARGDRARRAATVEAAGASIGGLGLVAFAIVGWRLLTRWPAWLALLLATVTWAVTASTGWLLRKASGKMIGRGSQPPIPRADRS